jgi:hypothetical protein
MIMIGDESFIVGLVFFYQPRMASNRICNSPVLFGSFFVLVSDQCCLVCRLLFPHNFWKTKHFFYPLPLFCLLIVNKHRPSSLHSLFSNRDQLLDCHFVSSGGAATLDCTAVILTDLIPSPL